jgi:farnesyl diphosphate synthase
MVDYIASAGLRGALDDIIQSMNDGFNRLIPCTEDPRSKLINAMRYSALGGGKRLRPLLVRATAALFDVEPRAVMRVALAVEAVHCYSLVHDDLPCMDDDDMRRGQPTTHKAFDEASAVLAGDALLTLAFEILSHVDTHPDPHVRCDLIASLAQAAGHNGMVGGQAMDIAAETSQFDLRTTTRLQQLKTGALIDFSVEAGAILGRASAESGTHLKGYARDLGLAFQITDDLLDAEGDPATTGKTVGKDAAAGKSTLVTLMGLDQAKNQAQALVSQAIDHLRSFDAKADLLRAIAQFAIVRDK